MRRICIYVTYDYENIVDAYIGYMLCELRKVVDCLVVVCNYISIAEGIENVKPYADRIYYRENIGFDSGAYKDALCQYLGWDEVCLYDELLLINDSFYGPLYSMESLFSTMEKEEADYWGLTRAPKGELRNGYQYDSHIQSYFLCFKKRIIQDNRFRRFWDRLKYAETYQQAIILYELACNKYLTECEFRGITLMDLCQIEYSHEENWNPYIKYPLELITKAKIPIFKRRCLSLENKDFGKALEALKFIETNSGYDIKLINNHLFRISRESTSHELINYANLEKFYCIHTKIYIYGAGMYGRNLAQYFAFRRWRFEGFLVTRAENHIKDCRSIEDVHIEDGDGIIIAVGNKECFIEILNTLKKYCNTEQIYNTEFI